MFQVDEKVKKHLGSKDEISDRIGSITVENFKKHLKALYKEDNLLDLKKLLGVLYAPITINMFDMDVEIDTQVLEALGLHMMGTEHLIKIATLMYIDNNFKEYGDSKVCESLNYISFKDGEVIERYWERI